LAVVLDDLVVDLELELVDLLVVLRVDFVVDALDASDSSAEARVISSTDTPSGILAFVLPCLM
jgi:hypothetical protein